MPAMDDIPTPAREGGRYELVARAIDLLVAQPAPPPIESIARRLGVAPLRLQRSFAAHAGVSPKRFVQFLAKEHAVSLLRDGRGSVLDCALSSGLSGPARLHDLVVRCEALSPGEARRLGEGVELRTAVISTPFGRAYVARSARGIVQLAFLGEGGEAAAREELRARWPRAGVVKDPGAGRGIGEAIGAIRALAPLHVELRGTNFQVKVWEALLRIPAGALVSYSELARSIGRPEATRAVAGAVAANPVAVLIPCHRVIRESGALGGYRWGLARKRALLAVEGARAAQPA
jgi:AraC family transcriptional regulator of adaptative response/methylated-DNA-[protein]-cysteine methyltransferase